MSHSLVEQVNDLLIERVHLLRIGRLGIRSDPAYQGIVDRLHRLIRQRGGLKRATFSSICASLKATILPDASCNCTTCLSIASIASRLR